MRCRRARADVTPDHPADSDFVRRLKGVLAAGDHESVEALLKAAAGGNPDATVELSNDDWMKDPSVQLPPAVLLAMPSGAHDAVGDRDGGGRMEARGRGSAQRAGRESRDPRERSRSSFRQPGMAFPCPPTLDALLARHWKDLQDGFSDPDELNRVLEFQSDELRWTSKKCGLWSLEYKRELTSPLCIAAAQGYTDCLRYLLEHGARPNLSAGGKTALHEACENSNTECVELLLEHGASPALLSEDGFSPLHLCRTPQSLRCAKALVRYGAAVDLPSEEEGETPLHVAARHGLQHHAQLYLRYGAEVNRRSGSGETPLVAACAGAQRPDVEGSYAELCRLLLAYGADVHLVDGERRSPLHRAARNVQHGLVQLLLEHRADINAIDYNGATPLSNVLQNAVVKAEHQPHLIVQTLLNHGSIKVWPLALLKVLSACAAAPKTVEILFNSYTQATVTYKWRDTIPEEVVQMHQPFYESLFALECRPRCLQHLCRSALRKRFGKDCHLLIPQLPIPKPLQQYLLLEPEGFLY
ncbi:ankyrin repeat and SOCS box protein 18 [Megalops cyprinoides]|uniref:ankyrin repeat and SOCS box protein 18 n=1 Tax=Megalops cyprinoides TaxID=118141 RepID=UPI001865647C|nr:ankyrin repeat and SOCS box protein 18 [Megalops cyprinoides]